MFAVLLTTVAFAVADAAPKTVSTAPSRPAAVAAKTPAPAVLAAANPEKPAPRKSAVFETMSDAAVADEVLSYLEGITTLSGSFVQTAPSGAVVTGKFNLRRPGQIRFDYDDPSPITIVATQGMVYVENSDLETTDSYPLKKTPLRFLLSKKIDIGDASLKSVTRGADSVAVTYASTDEETEGEITLVLAAPRLSIEEWSIVDAQGGVTSVALQGVTAGARLDNRLFAAPEAGGSFINN
jgi:outer membrane lipoprotein-sorting protein